MNDNDFYSIDRLVEFGLGVNIARQMVNCMNQGMQNMHVPGSMQNIQPQQPSIYYVAIEGKQAGPFNESEMMQLVSLRKISKETLAWTPGMNGWQPIENIPSILKLIALTPPPLKTE